MKQNAGNGISNRTNPPQDMIDTLSIASDLVAAGVAKPQAEAHARAIASAVGQQSGDLATKDFVRSEIGSLRAEMIGEIGSLQGEVGSLRADMTREIGALRTGASGDMRNLRPVVPGKTGCPIEGMRLLRAEMRAMEIRLVHWIVGTTLTTIALLFFALHFVSS